MNPRDGVSGPIGFLAKWFINPVPWLVFVSNPLIFYNRCYPTRELPFPIS